MNCRQCRKLLDNLLVARPDETTEAEMQTHIDQCDECAREFAAAEQALAFLTPTSELRASPDLKESIMNAISDTVFEDVRPIQQPSINATALRWWLAVMTAAAVLIAATYIFLPRPGPNATPGGSFSALQLFASACAAEELIFTGSDVVHVVNEIVVRPTGDPNWAKMRWLPMVSLDATGKMRFHQLTLPAEVGKGYTVKDESWFDPKSGKFSRVLAAEDKPLFANAYDGNAVYSLELADDGKAAVVRHETSENFQAPSSPAEYLGLGAGIVTSLNAKNKQFVTDAGETTLDDGVKARVLKTGFSQPEDKTMQLDAYFLFTIRADDSTIVKKEFFAGDQSLLLVRRVLCEPVEQPDVAWDLAGVADRVERSKSKSPIKIVPDMVRVSVSVEDMIKKADFETYVFSKAPAWAGPRQIADILDIVSPPKRMYAIAYKADDGRHVVLIQAPTYNRMIGPMVQKMGKVVYTSPGGIKVLSSSRDKWLAEILLQSAHAWIGPANSDDRTGYILQTPAGTCPALAVNGTMTDGELHALIDSLVPAKEYTKNKADNN